MNPKSIRTVQRLQQVKAGDMVTRYFADERGFSLTVTGITSDKIICGDWEFDRMTGAEIDDVLDWGPPPKATGSCIVREDA